MSAMSDEDELNVGSAMRCDAEVMDMACMRRAKERRLSKMNHF